ncbi:esterase/lipase family protein [Pseudomonas sp. Eth.TT006]
MQRNATTRYPILLVHGLFGFDRIGRFELFHEVKQALREAGSQVFVPQLSATHDNEVRGQQLMLQIERVLQGTGASKVNLIGHSQGALACRYAAALIPGKVASVTSVSGPNHGSELADALRQALIPGRLPEQLAELLATRFADLLSLLSGQPKLPQHAVAALKALTTEGVARFNSKYPQGLPSTWGGQGAEQVNGVHYYSWSGTVQGDLSPPVDPLHAVCRGLSGHFVVEAVQNDGFVGRYSSHLGTVIRSDYPLDHLATLRGSEELRKTAADPVELYVEHALRLKAAQL